ncbi:putative reverse transcriptase domain-containing protein [Tanacetum coccineum]
MEGVRLTILYSDLDRREDPEEEPIVEEPLKEPKEEGKLEDSEEEADLDFLSDARSRPGLAESDICALSLRCVVLEPLIIISTEFVPLLNVKPSIVRHGYVIEVAHSKKVEVDKIICGCILQLGNSLFAIDLVSFRHCSFNVMVRMDWLLKYKAEIVAMGMWLGYLGRWITTQTTSEFHIDLILEATPIAKSPYQLAPLEMQELSEQLQELQDKGFIRPNIRSGYHQLRVYEEDIPKTAFRTRKDHEVHLKLVLELLKKGKLFAKFSKCDFGYKKYMFLSMWLIVMIAKPLTTLTQKNQKYEWVVDQEEVFQTLKDNLCNAPIFSLPNGSEDFVVYCNATNQRLGCVLMQRGKSSIKDKLLAVQNEASKEENTLVEMLRGLDQQMEKIEDGGIYFMDRI